jgi:hypothetical protein
MNRNKKNCLHDSTIDNSVAVILNRLCHLDEIEDKISYEYGTSC